MATRLVRQVGISTILAALLVGFAATPASAKGWVQGKNPSIQYGVSAYIGVNVHPSYSDQKVNSIWAYRTDETALTEIGVTWDLSPDLPYAFWSTMEYGIPGSINPIDSLTPGTNPRFHTGYDTGSGIHYFWYNNNVVAETIIRTMTSSWPGTNSEEEDPMYGDYSAHFSTLKYKTSTWGVWQPFSDVTQYFDNVPYYYFKKQNTTEQYVLHV